MIPVYKYETEAGIAEAVRSSGSIIMASVANAIKVTDEDQQKFQQFLSSYADANPNQVDLFYLESILASVGWNLNDDVFDPKEIWAARHTPVDKQFNYMHDETDIIGHLTSSKIVDENGNVIEREANIPSKFDIVVGSVLYKSWSDNKLQGRMNKLIAEILEGKWCVSMECLFRNFDYAVITPEGINRVVARNDETSFLTKHLRIYGGTGEFDGNKIGRLLRNFTFSGKGLVDAPANPRSVITTTDDKSEKSSFAMATLDELNITSNEDDCNMTITQEQYDALQAKYEALEVKLASEAQKKLDDANATIAGLNEKITALTNELDASKEVANAKDEAIEAVKAELEEAKAELEKVEAEVAQQKLEATQAARKSQLLEKVDEEKAVALVDKFANASDEMFEALIESLPAKLDDKDKKDKKDKKDDKADANDDSDDDDDTSANVDTDIDDATASDDADMSTGGDETPDDIVKAAASWLTEGVIRSTAGKKNEGE
jgi:hypothetical protein